MQIRTAATLGLVIRARRRKLKLSQSELARKVGAGRHWVAAVERGKARAEIGLVLQTLNALEIPLTAGSVDYRLSPDEEELAPVDIDAVVEAARRPRP